MHAGFSFSRINVYLSHILIPIAMIDQQDLLTDPELDSVMLVRRRSVLPLWIKIFTWIFLVMGGLAMLVFLASFFGVRATLELYGFRTNDALSTEGLILVVVFLLKGIVAYGLWMEKEWAVRLGIIDAVIGILACAFQMLVVPFLGVGLHLSLRLELIALIPYLLKLRKLHIPWKLAVEKGL